MSDVVIIDSDECARAIDAALQAMNPPIEVHEGILTLIAKYAKPYGKWTGRHLTATGKRSGLFAITQLATRNVRML